MGGRGGAQAGSGGVGGRAGSSNGGSGAIGGAAGTAGAGGRGGSGGNDTGGAGESAGSGGAAGAAGTGAVAGMGGNAGSAGSAGIGGRGGGAGTVGLAGAGGGGSGGVGGAAGTGGTGGGSGASGSGGGAGAAGGAAPVCGDRVVEAGEGCDDGNAQTGDGCSPHCRQITALGTGWGTASCVILDDGHVKCWGYNSSQGELGLGDSQIRGDGANEMGDNLPAVDLGTGRRATSVTSGLGFACALLDDGHVKCWGQNVAGFLGIGDTDPRGGYPGQMGDNLPAVDLGTGRTARSVVSGNATCALLDDLSVKCWGPGGGLLGLGDPLPRGGAPGEMGDNLPTVKLGTGRTAKSIAAGGFSFCAILDDDSLKCWGKNDFGQLGLGDKETRGDGPNEMGDSLPAVNLGTGRFARSVSGGGNYYCALLDDGTVKCWGYAATGAVGLGDNNNRGDEPNEMGDNLPAVNLGAGRRAKAVSAGNTHTCALLDDDTLKCWGSNLGELGIGNAKAYGNSTMYPVSNVPIVNLGTGRTAKIISARTARTCALLDNDTLKCWGNSSFGQLGYGDTQTRGDDPMEMGDYLPAVQLP